MTEQHWVFVGGVKVTGPLDVSDTDGTVHIDRLATWERNAALALLVDSGADEEVVTFVRKTMGMRKADVAIESFVVEKR